MIGIFICGQIITQPYVNETFAICQYFHKYHEQFNQIMTLIHESTEICV